jgi:hypothetical protein
MNVPARFRNALLAVGLAAAVGCSSDDPKSPTAPPTTPVPPVTPVTYAVTVSPSKSVLTVNTNDFANVTITAARTDNGAAPPNLTKVTLTTTLGGFGSAGGPQTLEAELINGQVQVAFFPGGTVGTATLRAQVGDSVGFGSVRVAEETQTTFYISSVSPNTGSPQGGETVDILGGGFDPPIRVTFDGVAATVISSNESRVAVRTPALAGGLPSGQTRPVTVAVTINLNEEGTATDSLPSGFTYTNGGGGGILQPTIFSVTPASGPNEGGTEVVINGDGFEAPVQVKFGDGSSDANFDGAEATVLSVSRTRVVVRSPATSCSSAGCAQPTPNLLADILVKNLNTGRFTIASSAFKYGSKVIITSIGPGEGPSTGGQQVTLYGQGFDEPVAVGLANVAQQVLSVSGTEIVVRTVAVEITNCSDKSGPSQVTNIETGDGATGPTYIYRAIKPIITGVSPSSGSQGGGTNVTIAGVNFTSPMVVEFTIGGSTFSAQVTGITSTAITAKAPAVPNSVMSTESCDVDNDGTAGTRYIATAATVKVSSPITGCNDDFAGAFLYTPSSTGCVGD